MKQLLSRQVLFGALVIAFLLFAAFAFAQYDPQLFSEMKTRCIGPAGMSGRIGDIDAVSSNPDIIYVGAATGGLWKSTNGGTTWKSIFDDQPLSSIGSVTLFQKNPSIVWVGTGEGNPRNSVGVGNGIFKSLDAGETWEFMGLENTEKIHRVVVHPTDPNIVYAGALGSTWSENPERGVFKSVDGGKTWKKVLFVDPKTGCADLVMDPENPNKLFAGMWQHRRWPWFFKSGGPGSGLYVTYDAGENWKKLTAEDGLPKGDLGRIGVAVARTNPNVVYALIEAKKSVLCRSNDGGQSWEIVNRSPMSIRDRSTIVIYVWTVKTKTESTACIHGWLSVTMAVKILKHCVHRFIPIITHYGCTQRMRIISSTAMMVESISAWTAAKRGALLTISHWRNSTTSMWIWRYHTISMGGCRTTDPGADRTICGPSEVFVIFTGPK